MICPDVKCWPWLREHQKKMSEEIEMIIKDHFQCNIIQDFFEVQVDFKLVSRHDTFGNHLQYSFPFSSGRCPLKVDIGHLTSTSDVRTRKVSFSSIATLAGGPAHAMTSIISAYTAIGIGKAILRIPPISALLIEKYFYGKGFHWGCTFRIYYVP